MKIENIKQFESILEFVFSDEFENLKKAEKESVKKELALSVEKIDGAYRKLIKQVKEDLVKIRRFYSGSPSTYQPRKRIIYIFNIILEEDRKNILSEYIINENNIRGYEIDKLIFIPMINCFSDSLKVELISKSDTAVLLKLMSELNGIAQNKRYDRKKRKEYSKYYEICKKALKQ